MKTIKIECFVRTNRQGSDIRDTIEIVVEDDADEETIELAKEEASLEWAMEHIDFGFKD